MYDGTGRVTNENHLYKVEYDSQMYNIAVRQRNLRFEYGVIKLEKVVNLQGEVVKEIEFESGYPIDLYAEIEKDIVGIHEIKKEQTAEQKKLEEMEKMLEKQSKLIEALTNKGSKEAKEDVSVSDVDIDAIRAEYEALTGEKPHHRKTAEQLQARINQIKSN